MASEGLGTNARARRRLSSPIRRWVGRLLLEQQAQYMRQSALAQQQRLHWELLSKAIDDPDLAEVLDVYEEDVSPRVRRQYLFANALYTNLLFYYRIGNLTQDEFIRYARGIFQNPIVRNYWAATRLQRASIHAGADEAAAGQLIDQLLQQLDDADVEEWWVVGDPVE